MAVLNTLSNGQQDVVRLDSNGNATYDTWGTSEDTCVGRFYNSDHAVGRLNVQVSADAPSTERNRLLNFNTHCLSKIGGCKNASELLPIGD